MGIAISLLVGAAGAILRYAVTGSQQGFDLHTGGVILMFIGGLGLVLSMLFWSSFAPFGRENRTTGRSEGRVVRERHDRVSS